MIQSKSDDLKIACEEPDSTVALITDEKKFSADWKVEDGTGLGVDSIQRQKVGDLSSPLDLHSPLRTL